MFRRQCKKYYIVIFLLIFLLGIFLRGVNFAKYPRHGATFDEFAWTWLGINLIQKQMPVSWSSQPQYETRNHLIYQGAAFWIVKPYLEHPPLFGLIAGSFALINGVKDMYHVTLERIRPLSLMLGAFSILMVFILAKELYGKGVALISSLIYATAPTIVIGSRIVQNENFLIPLWLLTLYLISRYLKTKNKQLRNSAAVIAGLLSLAKVPWLVVGLSLAMLLSYKGRWKDAFIVIGIVIAFFSLFFLYGFYLDRELFISLWKLQLSRYAISFVGFFSVFTTPLLVDRFYIDGWIYFGWFSIFILCLNLKRNFILLLPFIAYLIVYIFAIPNEPSHGWYRYPFYPFLVISSAVFLREELKKISVLFLIFIFVVGLSLLASTWEKDFGFSYFIYRLFILLGTLSVFLPIWIEKKFKKINYKIVAFWIIVFALLNIWAVHTYIE